MNEVHISAELIDFIDPDGHTIATAPIRYLANRTVTPYVLALIGGWVKPTGCSATWLVDQMYLVHSRYNLSQMIKPT